MAAKSAEKIVLNLRIFIPLKKIPLFYNAFNEGGIKLYRTSHNLFFFTYHL